MNVRPVVVLTNESDLAADDVIRRISERGAAVVRVNIERATSAPIFSWRPTQLEGCNPGAVWWRQFELAREPTMNLAELDDLLVTRAQWRTWLACLHNPSVPWVNDLWAARRAENKIEQLRVANSVGFAIPDTIVTNDLSQARRLGSDDSLIVKTVASAYFELTDESFVYTRALSDDIFTQPDLWNNQPLIVQRRIDGHDVRVIAVGEEVFGATCKTDQADWRLAGASAEWHVWQVPDWIARCCRTYMREFGLEYAAFDFVHDDCDTWFLEANQAGEWSFLDRPLSLGIAQSLASMLIKLAS